MEIESAHHPVDVETAAVVGCDCSPTCVQRWLCTGWSGLLFGLSLAAGMLSILYFLTTLLPLAQLCRSHLECGQMFADNYTCQTPLCLEGQHYALAQLESIAQGGDFTTVQTAIEGIGNVTTYDQHALTCATDANSTDGLFAAIEKAALGCVHSRIDEGNTALSYIVATEQALLREDEPCHRDDAAAQYCSDQCECVDYDAYAVGPPASSVSTTTMLARKAADGDTLSVALQFTPRQSHSS